MPVIAQIIQENRLTFCFPEHALSTQYDEWTHYRRRFNGAFGGSKAVDLLYSQSDTGWLIEIKDYRDHPRTKAIDPAVLAQKLKALLKSIDRHPCVVDQYCSIRRCVALWELPW